MVGKSHTLDHTLLYIVRCFLTKGRNDTLGVNMLIRVCTRYKRALASEILIVILLI